MSGSFADGQNFDGEPKTDNEERMAARRRLVRLSLANGSWQQQDTLLNGLKSTQIRYANDVMIMLTGNPDLIIGNRIQNVIKTELNWCQNKRSIEMLNGSSSTKNG